MIDYIALSIGHGLMAYAFWHLFMRAGVDVDPLVDEIQQDEKAIRQRMSVAGRNAQRREQRREHRREQLSNHPRAKRGMRG